MSDGVVAPGSTPHENEKHDQKVARMDTLDPASDPRTAPANELVPSAWRLTVRWRNDAIAYLNTLTITGDNIGDIRRSLFMPFDCEWNGWIRDITAQFETRSPDGDGPWSESVEARSRQRWNSRIAPDRECGLATDYGARLSRDDDGERGSDTERDGNPTSSEPAESEPAESHTTSKLAQGSTPQKSHRCSGCDVRWIGVPELTGAELCGDCWREVQPILHGAPGIGETPRQPQRCNICDRPILHEFLCEDCLSQRGYEAWVVPPHASQPKDTDQHGHIGAPGAPPTWMKGPLTAEAQARFAALHASHPPADQKKEKTDICPRCLSKADHSPDEKECSDRCITRHRAAFDQQVAYTKFVEKKLDVAEAALTQLREGLTKINAIRNSIIGLQQVNWSEHVYPLVAALDAAGFEGMGHEAAREHVATLIDRACAAEDTVKSLSQGLHATIEKWRRLQAEDSGYAQRFAIMGDAESSSRHDIIAMLFERHAEDLAALLAASEGKPKG